MTDRNDIVSIPSADVPDLVRMVRSGDLDADNVSAVVDALEKLAGERDALAGTLRDARTHIETLALTRTSYSGIPPYVGWQGMAIALAEELNAAGRRIREPIEADEIDGPPDLTDAQRIGLTAIAAARAYPLARDGGPAADRAVRVEQEYVAEVIVRPGAEHAIEAAELRRLSAFVGGRVMARL